MSGWKWGRPAWRAVTVGYWQSRCLAYAAPPDQVVYEEIAGRLPGQAWPWNGYSVGDGTPMNGVRNHGARHFIPTPWIKYRGYTFDRAVLFLHERTTPGGVRHLVVVECLPRGRWFDGVINWLDPWAVKPVGWLREPPTWRHNTSGGMYGRPFPPPDTVRFFAGQPDPADASHFTIRVESQGPSGPVRGTIHGWLLDGNGQPGSAGGGTADGYAFKFDVVQDPP